MKLPCTFQASPSTSLQVMSAHTTRDRKAAQGNLPKFLTYKIKGYITLDGVLSH